MSEYQVIARKFRPKRFDEVVGQEAIVTTLVNAIKMRRTAHAYLFSGARGTGKTTLARLFAKALNCIALDPSTCEPCNQCPSCKEIDTSHAIDVLEIDGASHRGIEDVRQINETIIYAPTHGKYKIYIIDEVHMLTKEAFNALLKSLEEPPEKVKFFFATTEPHKIPATIISRCQRFHLNRIPPSKMGEKLSSIASELGVEIEKEALPLIAELSGGGLRDAESLLDQLISFYDKKITAKGVSELFGLLPKDRFEELDNAVKEHDVKVAFRIAEEVFSSGRAPEFFIEELIGHFRAKLTGKKPLGPYSQENCLNLIEMLAETENEIKFAFSPKTTVEMTLLRIIRSGKKLSIEELVERLLALEGRLKSSPKEVEQLSAPPKIVEQPPAKVINRESSADRDAQFQSASSSLKAPLGGLAAVQEERKQEIGIKEKSRFDTVTRFAAKELGGSLKKE
jgi:DNA polymerase-3 subunit gamma/tau